MDSQTKAKTTRKNFRQLASAVKTSAEAELDVELIHMKLIKSAQVILSKHNCDRRVVDFPSVFPKRRFPNSSFDFWFPLMCVYIFILPPPEKKTLDQPTNHPSLALSLPSFLPSPAYACIHSFICLFCWFYHPGVKEVNQGNSYDLDNLCALCRNECTTAIKGEYSDYDGAFRCLQAGAGDVAFIKHTTVGDNTQKPGNYKYLCLDGTTNGMYCIFIASYVSL